MRRLVIALAIAGVALLLWRLIDLLLLLFGAILVAVLLRALADPISRYMRLSPRPALLIALLLVAAVIAGSSWLFGSQLSEQMRQLSETVPEAWRWITQRAGRTALGARVLESMQNTEPGSAGVIAGISRFLLSLGNGIADMLLVVVAGVYLAAQPGLYRAGLLKLIPESRRAIAAGTMADCGRALRLWLLGQLVSMAVIGVLTTIGLLILGVPSALALGLVAGIAEFVPFVGPVVASIPALLVALSVEPQLALWVLGLYAVLQWLENAFIFPLIQQRAVALPPALTIFSLIAAGLLFGVAGILLAAPLTVVGFILVKRLYVREVLDTPTPLPGEQTSKR